MNPTQTPSGALNPPRQSAQMSNFGQTPSQTVGPYFAYGLTAVQYGYDFGQTFNATLALANAHGRRITITGRVLDGDGQPVPDAVVEISHADATGQYPATREQALEQGFTAFGRVGTGTDSAKRFVFQTIMPGAEEAGCAPCVHVVVTMRGLLMHAFTRIYFAEEASNATDPVLSSVAESRRNTMLATRANTGDHSTYTIDIHMQGANETVFFDL